MELPSLKDEEGRLVVAPIVASACVACDFHIKSWEMSVRIE